MKLIQPMKFEMNLNGGLALAVLPKKHDMFTDFHTINVEPGVQCRVRLQSDRKRRVVIVTLDECGSTMIIESAREHPEVKSAFGKNIIKAVMVQIFKIPDMAFGMSVNQPE